MITLGTTSMAPGEMNVSRLEVGESHNDGSVGLPVAVINGASSSKTLYMQATPDGDKLNGVGVIQRVVLQLDPADTSGVVLVVGIVSYHAFQITQHRNPVDDTRMSRACPGNKRGTSSECITVVTFAAAHDADLIVDLHRGSTNRMIDEVRVRCDRHHRMRVERLRLTETLSCGYILDQKGPDGQLTCAGPDAGIPTIDSELGGCVGWDEENVEKGARGVHNILRGYDFLGGDVELKAQTRAHGLDQHGSPVRGLVRFKHDLGEHAFAGDAMFEVADVFGTFKACATVNYNGIFRRTCRLPQIASGGYVYPIGIDLDAY